MNVAEGRIHLAISSANQAMYKHYANLQELKAQGTLL